MESEIAAEEDYQVPEPIPRVLHDDHHPDVCAMACNRVYGRNETLRIELIELVDKNISLMKEQTKLKKKNILLEIDMKSKAEKFGILEDEVKQSKKETMNFKIKLDEAMQQKMESDNEIGVMRKQVFDLDDAMQKELEYKEKILEQLEKSRSTNDAMAMRISTLQTENDELEKVLGNRKNRAEDLERAIDLREQELQQWAEKQIQEIEEQKRELELWHQEKELYEKEMDRLRDSNRAMRRELSHPNGKPEPDKLKSELNAYIAREDDLRRQLLKSNSELLKLQKLLKPQQNATLKKNTTLYQPTHSSAQKTRNM